MNGATLDTSALIDALRVETAGYRALITVLEAECDALRRADPDALSALTAAKLDHVSALHALATARTSLLQRTGCEDIGVALLAIGAAPDADVARREWSSLMQLARSARALNAINGRLIANQQRHFDGALGALLHAAGVPPVYGADGRPEVAASSRVRAAA